jgi:hypothetical protein
VLDSGGVLPKKQPRFFFESSWFEIPGFKEMVVNRWLEYAHRIT